MLTTDQRRLWSFIPGHLSLDPSTVSWGADTFGWYEPEENLWYNFRLSEDEITGRIFVTCTTRISPDGELVMKQVIFDLKLVYLSTVGQVKLIFLGERETTMLLEAGKAPDIKGPKKVGVTANA